MGIILCLVNSVRGHQTIALDTSLSTAESGSSPDWFDIHLEVKSRILLFTSKCARAEGRQRHLRAPLLWAVIAGTSRMHVA